MIRWRIPPENSCTNARARVLRLRYADRLHQRHRLLLGRFALRDVAVRTDLLCDLLADAQHRVERGHRILRDNGDLGPAYPLKLPLRGAERVRAPSKNARPLKRAFSALDNPMRLDVSTDFPEPDSPTMQRISPSSRKKLTPSTA